MFGVDVFVRDSAGRPADGIAIAERFCGGGGCATSGCSTGAVDSSVSSAGAGVGARVGIDGSAPVPRVCDGTCVDLGVVCDGTCADLGTSVVGTCVDLATWLVCNGTCVDRDGICVECDGIDVTGDCDGTGDGIDVDDAGGGIAADADGIALTRTGTPDDVPCAGVAARAGDCTAGRGDVPAGPTTRAGCAAGRAGIGVVVVVVGVLPLPTAGASRITGMRPV